jgi:hypothetical protein
MRKFLSVIALGVVAIAAYQRSHRTESAPAPVADPAAGLQVERDAPRVAVSGNSRFHCDGRTYCSEMTSCEEATWFLQNCPGVKMDGEGDGVPCERQWCGRR